MEFTEFWNFVMKKKTGYFSYFLKVTNVISLRSVLSVLYVVFEILTQIYSESMNELINY